MSLATFIKRIDRRYAWSLLGVLLTVPFGLLAIYSEFIRDRHLQVKFELISDTSVLDVKEKLGNLEIIYDGVDIQKVQKTLRILVFRIKNKGTQDILKGYYDEKAPFGFRVNNGSLVRTEVIGSSNTYLGNNIIIKAQPQNIALIDPIILESQE